MSATSRTGIISTYLAYKSLGYKISQESYAENLRSNN